MNNSRLLYMFSGAMLFVISSGSIADTLPPFNPFGTPNQPAQNSVPVNPQVQAALAGFWRGTDNMNQEIIFYFSPQGTGYLQQNNAQMNFSYTLAGNMMTISDNVSSMSFQFAVGQGILQLQFNGKVVTLRKTEQPQPVPQPQPQPVPQPQPQPVPQPQPQPIPQPQPQPETPVVQLSGKYQCQSSSVPGAIYVYDFMPAKYAVYVTMKGTKLRNTFLEYGSYKIEGDRFTYTILQNPVASLVGQTSVSYIIPASDGFVMKFSDYDIQCTR